MEILRTEGLQKVYGKGENEVIALDGVDLSVEKGDFVAVVGASGSGKSTLLHLLGGLDVPTGGKVFVDGDSIYEYDEEKLAIFRRRKIGFVFQFFNLLPVLSVEENIVLPVLLDHRQADQHRLEELMEMLGLSERRNHLPSELSGGQQQRVSIARALYSNPSIILADEPTGNLDSKNSEEVVDLLKTTARLYRQTVFLITHDIHIASQADRILTIVDGKIESDRRIRTSWEG